ncbi:class I SAM-dependent methyltransferase [Herbaspirillum sp. C7C2]|uniref:class I SAM-dependent methyltransferase n=1 Tax=Herbaspirillum sp. C7C2 TaxID=2736666 RepID=UPI001F51CEF7|nr:class I SAM-dependent methyltransferase [Herbaspirillum sp. C7C2]MCI1016467.1 class I SAM-dependent methyltransferase [Herbaspirillum sp. C7C2]
MDHPDSDTRHWTRPPLCACPLCGTLPAQPLLSLSLSQRAGLPSDITVSVCAACDFAYVAPVDAQAYDRYYAANTNDQMSVHAEISELDARRYVTQADTLAAILGGPEALDVLDVGCGEAGLLRTLVARFPQHRYAGSDPNVKEDAPGGRGAHPRIRFNRSWQEIDQQFDVIILSHVLEHIVDLKDFSAIVGKLAPGGKIYIEVPDAAHYASAPRREFCYYFDRLHVNHFSLASLSDVVRSWGLGIRQAGRQDFTYKDGNPFPACYVIGAAGGDSAAGLEARHGLPQALASYLAQERDRAGRMAAQFVPGQEIVVYGFGDNFFRSRAAGGPLSACRVRAVIDARWEALSQSAYGGQYRFMDRDAALREHAGLPIVVTVSWGGETIGRMLAEAGAQKVLVF